MVATRRSAIVLLVTLMSSLSANAEPLGAEATEVLMLEAPWHIQTGGETNYFIWSEDGSLCVRMYDPAAEACEDEGSWSRDGSEVCYELTWWGSAYGQDAACITVVPGRRGPGEIPRQGAERDDAAVLLGAGRPVGQAARAASRSGALTFEREETMRIAAANVHHLQIPMETGGPHGWGSEEWKALDFVLLELTADDGLTGWGEGWAYDCAPETVAAIETRVAPRLIGEEVGDIAALTDELLTGSDEQYGVAPAYAVSAANIALWDLAGKAAGVPLHRLLGAARQHRFPVFASLFQFEDPEIVKRMCRRALSDNMCWLKLHEHQEKCVRAAREVALDAVLVLDAFCAWTAEEAAEMAQILRPYDLHWLEEPIDPPSELEGLSPFKSAGIPVALGENASTAREFERMIDAGTVAYLEPGITRMGGIEKVREVVDLGRANGVAAHPWQPHFGPALLAYLHLNATLAEPVPVEFQYFESMAARLYGDAVWPDGGFLSLPQTPGLGFDPDPEVLSAFAA